MIVSPSVADSSFLKTLVGVQCAVQQGLVSPSGLSIPRPNTGLAARSLRCSSFQEPVAPAHPSLTEQEIITSPEPEVRSVIAVI